MSTLAVAVATLIKKAIFRSPLESEEDYLALFDKNTNKKVMMLCARILRKKLPLWLQATTKGRVSIQKMVDFDWRVDLISSSEYIAHTLVPTGIFRVSVENQATREGEIPAVQSVPFEADRAAVDTVVEGLRTIRDQLKGIGQSV
eukprot:g4695.t1